MAMTRRRPRIKGRGGTQTCADSANHSSSARWSRRSTTLMKARTWSSSLAFLGDQHPQVGRHLGVELDRHLVLAELLDGLVELDLALVDVDALAAEEVRDVARRHRAVERVVLAHLAGGDVAQGGDPVGDGL